MPTTCYNSPKQVSLQSTSLIWHSHVTYQFYFSTFLKQTLKLAKDSALKLPLHPHHGNQRYLHPVSVFLHLVPTFVFFLNQINRFVLMPCCECQQLSTTHLASPCLVILVVIATQCGRHQIWPIGREQFWRVSGPGARYFSHLFRWVTIQILRLDLQLEGAPLVVGPMHPHSLHIHLNPDFASLPMVHRLCSSGWTGWTWCLR